jgi:hypothetical protein
VVRTLATLVRELHAMGVVAEVVGPDRFRPIRISGFRFCRGASWRES